MGEAPERITREEAQAEIPGIVVAEIITDFANNFRDVYPTYLLARGVGPEQSMIGLAIKRGHLVRTDLSAAHEAAARRAGWNAAMEAAANEADEHKRFAKGIECLPECIRAMKETPHDQM